MLYFIFLYYYYYSAILCCSLLPSVARSLLVPPPRQSGRIFAHSLTIYQRSRLHVVWWCYMYIHICYTLYIDISVFLDLFPPTNGHTIYLQTVTGCCAVRAGLWRTAIRWPYYPIIA